jgi:hypothetical protein
MPGSYITTDSILHLLTPHFNVPALRQLMCCLQFQQCEKHNQACLIWSLNLFLQFTTILIFKTSIFWDITMCGRMKVNWQPTCRLHIRVWQICKTRNWHDLRAACFMPVSWLTYSSTLKTEATCSSETSGDFQWTTRHATLHNHRCENCKS